MKKRRTPLLLVFLSLMVSIVPEIAYSVSAIDGVNPNANGPIKSIAFQADGKIPASLRNECHFMTDLNGLDLTSQPDF